MINPDFVYAVICNVHQYMKPSESWGNAFLRTLQREIEATCKRHADQFIAIIDTPNDYRKMNDILDVVITKRGGLVKPRSKKQRVADFFELPELTDVCVTIIDDGYSLGLFSIKRLLQSFSINYLVTMLKDGPPRGSHANEKEIRNRIAKRYAREKGFNEVMTMGDQVLKELVPFPACKYDFLVMDFSEVSYYDKDWLYYDISASRYDWLRDAQ